MRSTIIYMFPNRLAIIMKRHQQQLFFFLSLSLPPGSFVPGFELVTATLRFNAI